MAIILPDHLESWSQSVDSIGRLPELIARLVAASAKVEKLRFPMEKATNLPGFDGLGTVMSHTSWLPMGDCVFEFGTDADPDGKAKRDYKKRKADPLNVDIGRTNYIQISPRKWPEATAWAKEMDAERAWQNVRAFGAIELALWLDSHPSVGRWASKYLFRSPAGYGSLYVPEECLQSKAAGQDIAQYRDALLAANRKYIDDLRAWLTGEEKVLSYEGDPWLMGALVHAVTLGLTDPALTAVLANSLFILDSHRWAETLDQQNGLWVVFHGAEMARLEYAVRVKGYHALVPRGCAPSAKVIVPIDPAMLPTVTNQSVAMGQVPDWLKGDRGVVNLGLWLAGAWINGTNDLAVIDNLSGRKERDLEDFLKVEASRSGLPLKRIGAVDRVELRPAYSQMALQSVSDADMRRFEESCLEVLSEADPVLDLEKGSRFYGNLLDARRKYSEELRKGLAGSLLAVSAFSSHSGPSRPATAGVAERVVRSLFSGIQSWKDVAKFNDVMAQLAEAAPQEFLESLERALDRNPEIFRQLFTESPDIGANHYTPLMWALEQLAWYPTQIARALLLLAGLDVLTPEGMNVYPQPRSAALTSASLRLRNTMASQEQILIALELVRRKYPDVWWAWTCKLVRHAHSGAGDINDPPAALGVEDMEAERKEFYRGYARASDELLAKMISEAGAEEARWAYLVEILPLQTLALQKTILAGVKSWMASRREGR